MSLIKSSVLFALTLSCITFNIIHAAPVSEGEPEALIICRADVVFCVDNSGSIRDSNVNGTKDNWQSVIDFLVAVAERLSISQDGTQVGLVTFGNKAYPEFDLNKYQTEPEVTTAMKNLQYRGENTNMTGGMQVCNDMLTNPIYGARQGIPKVLILVTDGKPTYEAEKLPQEVATIKASGTRIVAVGVTNQVNETQLKSMASTPEDYVYGSNFSSLQYVADAVLNNNTCQPVPPTTTPKSTTPTSTTTTTTATPSSTTTVASTTIPTTTTTTTQIPSTTTTQIPTTTTTTTTTTTRTSTPSTTSSTTTATTTTTSTTTTRATSPTTTTTTAPTSKTTIFAAPIKQCPANCQSCGQDATRCDVCAAGYIKTAAGTCSSPTCDPNCDGTCTTQGVNRCDSTCKPNYALNSDYNCVPCDGKCLECKGNGKKCNFCKKGRPTADGSCSCSPNCKSCDKSGSNNCDACMNGYIHSGGQGCKRVDNANLEVAPTTPQPPSASTTLLKTLAPCTETGNKPGKPDKVSKEQSGKPEKGSKAEPGQPEKATQTKPGKSDGGSNSQENGGSAGSSEDNSQ